jgi:hypothetical protein
MSNRWLFFRDPFVSNWFVPDDATISQRTALKHQEDWLPYLQDVQSFSRY